MGVGRAFRKKPLRRPKKVGTDRRRRERLLRERLAETGVAAATVASMNPKQVRLLMRERQAIKA